MYVIKFNLINYIFYYLYYFYNYKSLYLITLTWYK